MNFSEYNFDGIVGPTHNYAGLAVGNVASKNNLYSTSNPKDAALQGLAKMKRLHDFGINQAVIPPQPRPDLSLLKNLGFLGTHEQILKKALKEEPRLFAASYSASAMWTANSSTVTPSLDTTNNLVNFTPANLAYNLHRSIEATVTLDIFKKIFSNPDCFKVHPFLVQAQELGDEGAANYTRFCTNYDSAGVALFVYGQEYYAKQKVKPKIFPARQTLEASQAIARQHQIHGNRAVFIQQHPAAIDAGVFHNDVCAVGNQNILLCHESAFVDQTRNLDKLKEVCLVNNIDLNIITISSEQLAIKDMVTSYLFNSQLVTLSNGEMLLIAPQECYENENARSVIQDIISDQSQVINHVDFVDCRQSMRNGGGPACLRLRVVLSSTEAQAVNGQVIFNEQLYMQLVRWVNKYYRDKLELNDLLDPELINQSYAALDELTKILELDSLYSFQKYNS